MKKRFDEMEPGEFFGQYNNICSGLLHQYKKISDDQFAEVDNKGQITYSHIRQELDIYDTRTNGIFSEEQLFGLLAFEFDIFTLKKDGDQ